MNAPITYKVTVTGLDRLGEDAEALALIRAEQRVGKAMKVVVDQIEANLDHPGSGRFYKSRRSEGGIHQASAPGEPPAPDRYNLLTSWSYSVERVGKRVIGSIASSLWHVYARRLELGGWGGGAYIAPRPYIRPAMNQTDHKVQRILDGEED